MLFSCCVDVLRLQRRFNRQSRPLPFCSTTESLYDIQLLFTASLAIVFLRLLSLALYMPPPRKLGLTLSKSHPGLYGFGQASNASVNPIDSLFSINHLTIMASRSTKSQPIDVEFDCFLSNAPSMIVTASCPSRVLLLRTPLDSCCQQPHYLSNFSCPSWPLVCEVDKGWHPV